VHSHTTTTCSFSFQFYGDPRDLHSFPTRRSSDLDEIDRVHALVLLAPVERLGNLPAGHVLDLGDQLVGVHGLDPVHLGLTAIRRSEEHTSELQSRENLVCRLLLEKKKKNNVPHTY